MFTDGTVNENDGNPLVDDLYYYSRYHQIWTANGDADADYAQFGWQQGRNPSAFFDTTLYLVANSDVAAAGVNPLEHFHLFGWKEGRLPSVSFDTFQYLQNNPDVAAAGVDPLEHFLTFGREEARPSYMSAFSVVGPSGFDYAFYLLQNPDVAAAGVDPLEHFQIFGWKEGRNPNAYFDTRGYLATYTDVAAAGVNPFEHYLMFGWKEGRDPSPAFDTTAYLLANPDVAAAGVNPLIHYLQYGVHEGRAAFAELITSTSGTGILPEGAAAGSATGIDLSWGDWASPALVFSITGDTSGGGFVVDPSTGVITVADSTKLDFEASGGSYTVTVLAQNGSLTHSQDFVIAITDVIPTTPVDGNATADTVAEGAANGSAVGVTLFSDEPNGPPVTYELTDNAGGSFAVDPNTGVVTVANGALLDFETSGPAHTFTISGRATVGAAVTPTQNFTITVLDAAPSVPLDTNVAANSVTEGDATGTAVGVTVFASDPNGPAATYALTDSAGGRFQIDAATGVVTVGPNANLIDFESAPGHAYTITAQATAGALTSTQTFTINVANVNKAPAGTDNTVSTPEDTSYTFAAQDFGFSDPGDSAAPNAFISVLITTLPGSGTLLNDNVAVGIGQSVLVTDIAAGKLKFAPPSNANGAGLASFSFQVQDDGGTANGGLDTDQSPNTLTINVTAVNDAPSFTVGANQTVNEDAGQQTVNGFATGISAGPADEAGQAVDFIVTNNDNALFAVQPTIDALGNLTYTPAANANGSATVTVQIHDNGGGADTSAAQTFVLTVNAVNDAPVNAVPGAQSVNEDTDLVLSGANALSISDVDIGAGNATVALSVGSGVLTLSGTAGLIFSVGDGTSDATMTFSGTVGAINAALDGLVYRGNLNASGLDTLTLTTDDQGNTGSGGAQADTDTVAINVNGVNDAPTATNLTQSLTINEDAAATTLFTAAPVVNDIDSPIVTATLTIASAAGTLGGAGSAAVTAAT